MHACERERERKIERDRDRKFSFVKLVGYMAGMMSINNHLKGVLSFSGILGFSGVFDIKYLLIFISGMMCRKCQDIP